MADYKPIRHQKFQEAQAGFGLFFGSPLYRVYREGTFPLGPMKEPDDSAVPPRPACFEATRWTVVLKAAQSRAPGGSDALAQLCARYWRPLYAFARGLGHGPEDAQDLVQG